MPTPVEPGPGQESVWDYPRPPRRAAVHRRRRVVLGALLLEAGSSWCEWKGSAHYYSVRGGEQIAQRSAWSYAHPNPEYRELAGMVAFYPALMDACFVDDELVCAQPGGFYGGWITSEVVGPFKGSPGTNWW